MGIYQLWKKEKLKELDETKRLSILNELDVGYRKMHGAVILLLMHAFAAFGFLFVAIGVDVAVGLSWLKFGILIFFALFFFVLGWVLANRRVSEIEAEMQKELEGK